MTLLCAWASLASAQQPVSGAQPVPAALQQNGQATQASASGERRRVQAVRLGDGDAIALDGRLDEPVWTRAVPASDFIQIDPDNGQPATEKTEVRIAFNADALYIGVTCYDSDPNGSIAYQRRRDEGLPSDDKIRWTIDTFLDARSGYFFEMNPLGAMSDALMGTNGQNRAWDGIWNARARRSEIGWTLEIELPFRTFNFNPNSDTWGINFERTIQRKNETSIWSGWARNQGLQRMTNAGLVTGIEGATQGHGLDIKPYGAYIAQASPGRSSPGMTGDASAGVDFFYNPTPLLRANFTVNTDFAQTEVDQRQVNLTRYSLFFPEQRDFFLDGATFLDFASDPSRNNFDRNNTDDQVIPFFSRRIGLSAGATPQRIDFGTKVTGQLGAQDVGLLHVRTGEDEGFTSEDFVVARVKRRVMMQSSIGALYTRRDPVAAGTGTRHTAGLDMSLATSTFRGNQNLEVKAWFLHAARPGVSTGNSAFGGSLEYPNDRWNLRFETTEVQANFDPAVGFLRRQNYRRYAPWLRFRPRPRNNPYIRQFWFDGTIDTMTDLRNQLLNRDLEFTLFGMQFQSGDFFAITATDRRERLDAPFAISRTIMLPRGATYDYSRFRINGRTAERRMLSINGRVETGEFYSGTRTQRQMNLNVRMRPGLIMYLTGEWNSVRLAEGRFATRLYRLVGETQLNPFVSLVNDVQYDTQSAVLGWQSRFRWILTPGNDLYVVYTHNWLDDPLLNRFATLDRRAASKILYTYRF
ncbi:MAG: carbohydrate binding family 9 domain-containing protein [Acidobacteria bacterium]|nr:carbohydrate binding family 9 domain-containing protein [Acidobacteriota bacterium]